METTENHDNITLSLNLYQYVKFNLYRIFENKFKF